MLRKLKQENPCTPNSQGVPIFMADLLSPPTSSFQLASALLKRELRFPKNGEPKCFGCDGQ